MPKNRVETNSKETVTVTETKHSQNLHQPSDVYTSIHTPPQTTSKTNNVKTVVELLIRLSLKHSATSAISSSSNDTDTEEAINEVITKEQVKALSIVDVASIYESYVRKSAFLKTNGGYNIIHHKDGVEGEFLVSNEQISYVFVYSVFMRVWVQVYGAGESESDCVGSRVGGEIDVSIGGSGDGKDSDDDSDDDSDLDSNATYTSMSMSTSTSIAMTMTMRNSKTNVVANVVTSVLNDIEFILSTMLLPKSSSQCSILIPIMIALLKSFITPPSLSKTFSCSSSNSSSSEEVVKYLVFRIDCILVMLSNEDEDEDGRRANSYKALQSDVSVRLEQLVSNANATAAVTANVTIGSLPLLLPLQYGDQLNGNRNNKVKLKVSKVDVKSVNEILSILKFNDDDGDNGNDGNDGNDGGSIDGNDDNDDNGQAVLHHHDYDYEYCTSQHLLRLTNEKTSPRSINMALRAFLRFLTSQMRTKSHPTTNSNASATQSNNASTNTNTNTNAKIVHVIAGVINKYVGYVELPPSTTVYAVHEKVLLPSSLSTFGSKNSSSRRRVGDMDEDKDKGDEDEYGASASASACSDELSCIIVDVCFRILEVVHININNNDNNIDNNIDIDIVIDTVTDVTKVPTTAFRIKDELGNNIPFSKNSKKIEGTHDQDQDHVQVKGLKLKNNTLIAGYLSYTAATFARFRRDELRQRIRMRGFIVDISNEISRVYIIMSKSESESDETSASASKSEDANEVSSERMRMGRLAEVATNKKRLIVLYSTLHNLTLHLQNPKKMKMKNRSNTTSTVKTETQRFSIDIDADIDMGDIVNPRETLPLLLNIIYPPPYYPRYYSKTKAPLPSEIDGLDLVLPSISLLILSSLLLLEVEVEGEGGEYGSKSDRSICVSIMKRHTAKTVSALIGCFSRRYDWLNSCNVASCASCECECECECKIDEIMRACVTVCKLLKHGEGSNNCQVSNFLNEVKAECKGKKGVGVRWFCDEVEERGE